MRRGHFPDVRLRRNRQTSAVRNLVAQTSLSIHDLIWPCFVVEDQQAEYELDNFPTVFHFGIERLYHKIERLCETGLKTVMVFPVVNERDSTASEAFNDQALIYQALRGLRQRFPHLTLICDVAFDPYTDHGHDGFLDSGGHVDNDTTVQALADYAMRLADNGCDTVAPSDMMDGRIGAIRQKLDRHGHAQVRILSYAVKYASSFYGPFRNAVQSKTRLASDKKNYQMDIRNGDEAIHEVELDLSEGADWVMVKPASLYLDVIYRLRQQFQVPLFAYQVSGEYASLLAGAKQGVLEFDSALLESLFAIKRAGATGIVCYGADRLAETWRQNPPLI